ncbi:Uncharacterized protein Adt_38784 [Abeliophyllum distichum]|uniref:Retrotransposon gag domain-containing protein n=1 Tax=Abeliophyllum distichum TaxID=126358 RepID=A0ABD1Q4X7_9LAMI
MTETRSKTHEEHLCKMDKEIGDLSAAYKALSSKVESSDLTLKVLCNRQERVENIMTEMNQKYESLVAMMAQINGGRNDTKEKQAESSVPQNVSRRDMGSHRLGVAPNIHVREEGRMNTRIPKINFPYFSGEGAREWLRKARKYFQLHQVNEELKVGTVEMYLKGKANICFHGFAASHFEANWNVFTDELCMRFAKMTRKEVVEIFSKFRQFDTISEDQKKLKN